MVRLLLASQSPRRRALLENAGLHVDVVAGNYDERVEAGESAEPYARRVAAGKLEAARAASGRSDDAWWLAADTVVWFEGDGQPLGKPGDRAEAEHMLTKLASPTPHLVTTAWAIAWADSAPEVFTESTRVVMRELRADEMQAYLDKNTWCDKAGGYGIQDDAGAWVLRIEGSYTNVVGLPVAQVLRYLQTARQP